MAERPMLMSAPMVRAILAGTKTQTRRIVKPQPTGFIGGPGVIMPNGAPAALIPMDDTVEPFGRQIICPYGQPGDQLWVREAWARTTVCGTEMIVYREGDNRTDYGGPWKPGIHLFRKDSRITLEITGVRVERLQDISEEDAEAEGIGFLRSIPDADETLTARELFECLWESINGADSWAANPWVWVIEFRRVKP